MLVKVFEDIQNNKKQFLASQTGEDFENKILKSLKKHGFTHILKDDNDINNILSEIKKRIHYKLDTDFINIDDIKNLNKQILPCFVAFPYGSQNFPDFLVFTKTKIVPIEVKYSEKKSCKPFWNSNPPKANAIYIFGVYGKDDITFFIGEDVLPMNERKLIVDFFDKAKNLTKEFQNKLKELYDKNEIQLDRGFYVYIRNAYEQKSNINKTANLNYLIHPDRAIVEQNVIDFCNSL